MVREAFQAVMIVAAFAGVARAEAWYVVEATPGGAIIMDADSRKLDGGTFLTARLVHPGIDVRKTPPIIASQFREEFDCKEGRLRTLEFSLIDLDGRVPPGLSMSPKDEWKATETEKPSGVYKRYACDGVLPTGARGPYSFTDFEAKYLMWVGGKTAELEGPRH